MRPTIDHGGDKPKHTTVACYRTLFCIYECVYMGHSANRIGFGFPLKNQRYTTCISDKLINERDDFNLNYSKMVLTHIAALTLDKCSNLCGDAIEGVCH